VLFTKHAGHWKNPTYDNVIMRAYNTINDVTAALQNGTLDVAYGVNVLTPSAFLSLATASGSDTVTHQATTDLNTRLLVLNSGGRLNTPDLRKVVMGILAAARAGASHTNPLCVDLAGWYVCPSTNPLSAGLSVCRSLRR
jgi:ABC-type transport system substrate-binding protein